MYHDDWIVNSFTNLISKEMRAHRLSVADLIFWFLKVATATHMPSHLIFSFFGSTVWHGGSSSLTRDRIYASCIRSEESYLLDWTGSPSVDFLTIWCCYSFPFLKKEITFYLFIWPYLMACGILVPPTGIKPRTPAVKAGNPAICPEWWQSVFPPLECRKIPVSALTHRTW